MSRKRRKGAFRESRLAHRYLDGLTGLEIGASTHNPFGLATRNVGLRDEIYAAEQLRLTGEVAPLHIVARADDIPVPVESEEFVLSSHVIEHCPDFAGTLLEWYRIIRPSGYLFMIVPHRDAAPSDMGRPLTEWRHLVEDFVRGADGSSEPGAGVFGHCHYHVFDPDSMKEFIGLLFGDRLELVEEQANDDKIGNGFTLVYRKRRTLDESFPWYVPLDSRAMDDRCPLALCPAPHPVKKTVIVSSTHSPAPGGPAPGPARGEARRAGLAPGPAGHEAPEAPGDRPAADRPLFSILVPTDRRADMLPAALNSLLAQTDPRWEAIVIDNGSRDDAPDVVSWYMARDGRIRTIRRENATPGAAWNAGLREARGEWICFLPADGFYAPGRLAAQAAAILEQPDGRFFLAGRDLVDERTRRPPAPPDIPPAPEFRVLGFFHRNYVHSVSVAVHRSVFDVVGFFNEELRHAPDVEMWLRITARYPSVFLVGRTRSTRVHEGPAAAAAQECRAFDTARNCSEFLAAHSWADLFPRLNLRSTRGAVRAFRETMKLACSAEAHLHRCGYEPLLLEKLLAWLDREASGTARLVLDGLLRSYRSGIPSCRLPAEVRAQLRRGRDRHPEPPAPGGSRDRATGHARPEPAASRSHLDRAAAQARRHALEGREEEAAALARYLDSYRRPAPGADVEVVPPPEKGPVNLVMVTYDRLEFTREAIASIARFAQPSCVLTVVDNGSRDGTPGFLAELHRQGVIQNLILIGRNVGVARAANLGWKMEPEAAHYLKYDNDIVIEKPGWLAAMVTAVERIPEIGAVAYSFEPVSYPVRRVAGLPLRVRAAGSLGGACVLIPRRTERVLGCWSEEYGLYGEEDADYGLRIRLAGLYNVYMEDEQIGRHLPAGRAAAIDSRDFTAVDGMEEVEHREYRQWKDSQRRQHARRGGLFRENIRAYEKGRKPLFQDSRFVKALQAGGLDLSAHRGKVLVLDRLPDTGAGA